MKTFLQNLLILFCFALCGLIAFQWVRETRLRDEIRALHDTVYKKAELIQNLEGQLKNTQTEATRLDKLRIELTETVKSNRVELAEMSKKNDQLEKELDAQKRRVELYKDATERANESITEQNKIIKEQNAKMKELADDRNQIVEKYNETVKQYNDVVGKYNELAKLYEKLQADFVEFQNKQQQQKK
jgi:septal ring factor EnvC (AmiA/AmiB activator)